jgi:hypothetical protein
MKALRILLLFISLTLSYSISAQTVYTTKTGEKYHKSSCHYLKHSKKLIKLDRAKTLGYTACKVCKPTIKNTKQESNSIASKEETKPKSTATKKITATQCTGKTKSGKRCKRKTKNANGRCYQH